MAEQIGIKLALDGAGAVQSGLRSVSDALGNLGARTISVADAFRGLAPALAASLSVGAITAWARGAVNAIDAMNDLADATGATVEQISALDGFARRTGTTLDSVGGILVKFNAVLNQTGADNGVSQALRAIGLDTAALKKQDPVQALQATAQALSQFADDGNKARLVQELFGKSIREAAPILKDLAEAGQLNAMMTARQTAEAERFNRHLAQFQANVTDAGRAVATSFLPVVSEILKGFDTGAAGANKFSTALEAITIPVEALAVFGANVAFVFQAVGREFGGIAAQLEALSRGDLKGFRAIGEAMREDAKKAREELDAYEKRVLGARAAARQPTAGSGASARPLPSVPDLARLNDAQRARQTELDIRASQDLARLRREDQAQQDADAAARQMLADERKREESYAEWRMQQGDEVARTLIQHEQAVADFMRQQDEARVAELRIRADQQLAAIQRTDQAQAEADATAARAAQERLDADARSSLLTLQRYDDAVNAAEEAYRRQSAGYAEYVLSLADDTARAQIQLNQYEADWLKQDDEQRRRREASYAEYLLEVQDDVTRTQISNEQALKRYLDDNTEARTRALQTLGDRINQMRVEAQATELAAQQSISLAEAIEQITIARLREQQSMYRPGGEGWREVQAEIDARLELLRLMGDERVRDANLRAAQNAANAWQRTVDQISQSLADALMNGGMKAGEALKNYFRTLILQPIIRAVVDPIARSVLGMLGLGTASVGAAAQGAGAAAGAAGGGAGVTGMLGMLGLSGAKLGAYGQLFSATAGSAMTGWAGVSQALGHSINAPLGQGLAMGAGTIAGTLGPIAIGQMLGRGISGGYSALGGRSGSTAVNLGTAMGAIYGPVGMAIGAIIGGIANRAFGRKLTEQGITGTFGGEAGFSGNAYTFERGGWFRSDRTRTSALDPVMGGMLGQAYGALRTSTQAMADVLGQSGEAVRKFTADVRINLRGLSDQQVTQRLQEEMTKLAESLADAALGTREYTRLGETQAQALTRLSGSLSAVNAALDLLNRTTLTASLQSADLASQLSDLFGGDQGLSSAVAAFQQAFYTEAERTAIATRQVTAEMAKLHLALPQTRAQFRAIVEAQDLNTEAGRKMFAALLQIAPAFDKVTASIDTVAGRLGTLAAQLVTEAQTAIQQQITASQAAANAARQAAEAYRGASATLLDTAGALRGQAAPGASAAAAYRAGLAAAQGGDVTAMQGLSGLAQSYAESLRGSASSRAQYLAGTRGIAAELEAVAGTAGGLATQRSVQAALLDVNTAVLQTLAEDLQNGNLTVELLQEHSRSLASIAGALGNTGPVVQRLTGVDEGTSGVVEAQQLAGDLLASSDLTLARVLAKLGEPDANAAALAERVQSGNQLIADRLSSVIAAIGAQTAAQQAEIKRQQDLVKAQKDLESAASYLGTLQGSLSQAQATLAGTSPTMSVRVGSRYDWLGQRKGGIYEERSNPAYQTAVDAVNAAQQALAVYAPQVDQLRNLIRSLGGVPQFALGGLHTGGLRLVGERGPELEVTGPARYWSAADTTAMLGNSQRRDEALVAEIRALREQVARLEAAQVQTAVNTGKTQRLMQRVTRDGESMQIVDVTPAP